MSNMSRESEKMKFYSFKVEVIEDHNGRFCRMKTIFLFRIILIIFNQPSKKKDKIVAHRNFAKQRLHKISRRKF
jgi:hypothetical protein